MDKYSYLQKIKNNFQSSIKLIKQLKFTNKKTKSLT
jgi:hypothetical protein